MKSKILFFFMVIILIISGGSAVSAKEKITSWVEYDSIQVGGVADRGANTEGRANNSLRGSRPSNVSENSHSAPDPFEYFAYYGCPLPGQDVPGDACRLNPSCETLQDEQGVVHRVYRRLQGQEEWESTATSYCARPGSQSPEDAEAQTADPVVTAEDFQKMPIKPMSISFQPGSDTLKNYNTNVYLSGGQQILDTEIVGRPVRVRATPVEYTYDYGDGATKGPLADPGQALADDAWDVETSTSHRYSKTGNYSVIVTTTFRGEFSVEGGPWQPIDGTATVASPAENITVWKTRSGWVQDSCAENPQAWGC